MSFLSGLMNVLADTAQARVRLEAQKAARRSAGKQQASGCAPCAANQRVMERYQANQAANKANRR